MLGCCPCLPGGLGPPVAELAGLGPGCKSSLRFGPMRSQEPTRVPCSVLGLSVRLPQDCKPPGRGGGRKYLNCWGSSWEPFSLLFLCPSALRPLPSSHLLIPSFSKSSDCLLWAQPWTGRCQELGMIQTGVCPWGAPGLVRKVAW